MRPTKDHYFMAVAKVIATRATCDRKHVGAVIVNARGTIVSSGYNGAPSGMPHCDDHGHELKEIDGRESCVRTLHAESNAIDSAGADRALGCTLYVTVIPCYDCAKRIVNVGIRRVVYGEFYQSRNTDLVAGLLGDRLVQLEQETTDGNESEEGNQGQEAGEESRTEEEGNQAQGEVHEEEG